MALGVEVALFTAAPVALRELVIVMQEGVTHDRIFASVCRTQSTQSHTLVIHSGTLELVFCITSLFYAFLADV